MRFAYLGSGSGGNSALICEGGTQLMLDCGFTRKEAEARLERLGIAPAELTAILVTHEHSDHIGGVARLARQYRVPVYMTHGTYESWGDRKVPRVEFFNSHEPFSIGDIEIQPYPVPHDAREPCQFVFSNGQRRLGILSDAGSVTLYMKEMLSGCDALAVECNHDVEMLRIGPYPPGLKNRVGGSLGHLSNDQCADLMQALGAEGLQHLVATHLSDKNNRPELARAALAHAVGCEQTWIAVADQHAGLDWREIQ